MNKVCWRKRFALTLTGLTKEAIACLTNSHSSTKRLTRHYQRVEIKLIQQKTMCLPSAIMRDLLLENNHGFVREIFMCVPHKNQHSQFLGSKNVMYAKVIMPMDAAKYFVKLRLSPKIAIGNYLFKKPKWQRSEFVYKRLHQWDPEYPRCLDGNPYWARYSTFSKKLSKITLLEIFLRLPL